VQDVKTGPASELIGKTRVSYPRPARPRPAIMSHHYAGDHGQRGSRNSGLEESTREGTVDHDGVMHDWRERADENYEKNDLFLRSLKRRGCGFDPDEAAAELHRQAFQFVDCTRCANCCKNERVTVTVNQPDIDRLAGHLGLSEEEFIRAYLEPAKDGRYRIRGQPCPFLGGDSRCTTYAVRPDGCREYPHTDTEGFVFRTHRHTENTKHCPAVFWIVEGLRLRATGEAG
jgi:Fe-S-cluster containining protein